MSNYTYNLKQIDVAYKGMRKDITKSTYYLAEKIGKLLVRKIKKVLRNKGYKVSSRLLKSIEYKINTEIRGYVVNVYSTASYAKYVIKGRSPGRFPNIGSIKYWVEQGNFRGKIADEDINSLVYLISRSIANKGIKPFDFLKQGLVLAEPQIERYIEQLGKNYGVRI